MNSSARVKQPLGSRGRVGPWLVVALLSLLYAVSFIDRMIIALLVDPIKADLGVSDTQIGLLFGFGFALLYMLGGIPVAHFIDRGNRRRILIGGVILWSATTFFAAFAQSYLGLLVTRAGVAIGEAVLTPVAVSMIADLFPRDRRSLPTSIYSMVGAIMGTGAFIVGAGAIVMAGWFADILDIAVWRITLMIVSVPGFVMAAVVAWLVAEPVRGRHDVGGVQNASFAETSAYVWRHAGLYIVFFSGIGFMLAVAMSLVAWIPTLLMRTFDVPAAQAGFMFGMSSVIGTVAGTLSVSSVVRLLGGACPERGVIRAASLYAILAAFALIATIQSSNIGLLLFGIALSMFGFTASAVLSSLLVQLATPAGMRARVIALYLSLSGMLSLGIGPVLVSVLSEHHFMGGTGLAHALVVLSVFALIAALVCYFVANRSIGRLLHSTSA